MTARRTAVDPELMLQAEDFRISEVQEVCSTAVGVQLFFVQFEAHSLWVVVSLGPVIYRSDDTFGGWCGTCDRLTKVLGKCCDSAQGRLAVSPKCDPKRWIEITQDFLLKLEVMLHQTTEARYKHRPYFFPEDRSADLCRCEPSS